MEINIRKYSSQLINIVKDDNVINNVVSIIGFMLLLKKRGILSDAKKVYTYGNDSISEFISLMLINESKDVIDIWSLISQDFHILKDSTVRNLAYIIDKVVAQEYLAVVFDEVIKQSAKELSKEIGQSFQPTEISELIFKLTDSVTPMVVYNPFAGMASYGVLFGKKHHYIGQEIDRYVWAIGKIRLILNDAYVYCKLPLFRTACN